MYALYHSQLFHISNFLTECKAYTISKAYSTFSYRHNYEIMNNTD